MKERRDQQPLDRLGQRSVTVTDGPRPDPLEPARHKVEAPSAADGFVPMVPGERSLLRRVLRPTLRRWMRLRVDGIEHVPPSGAVLIASTHQSHADSVAIATAAGRPVHFLGDLRLTRFPVLGSRLPRLGMVPLRRGEADASALDVLRNLLAAGAAVVVYPEGSRSRDGRVHRLRSGVARLAADTGVPVVPAAVVGTRELWPVGGRPRWRGGRVLVRFGPVMAPPDAAPRSRRAFTERLHDQLVGLSGLERADDFSPFGGGDGGPDR